MLLDFMEEQATARCNRLHAHQASTTVFELPSAFSSCVHLNPGAIVNPTNATTKATRMARLRVFVFPLFMAIPYFSFLAFCFLSRVPWPQIGNSHAY